MSKIELIPDLDHCIETVAKKKHAELTRMLLGGKAGDSEMEEQLETLRLFLETADFGELRAESEKHLAAGKKVRFRVYCKNGILNYEMDIIQVIPTARRN